MNLLHIERATQCMYVEQNWPKIVKMKFILAKLLDSKKIINSSVRQKRLSLIRRKNNQAYRSDMSWFLWEVVAEMELGVWITLLKGWGSSSTGQGNWIVYNTGLTQSLSAQWVAPEPRFPVVGVLHFSGVRWALAPSPSSIITVNALSYLHVFSYHCLA